LERRQLAAASVDSLESLDIGDANGLGGLVLGLTVRGELVLGGRRSVRDVLKAELEAGDLGQGDLGAVDLRGVSKGCYVYG
jgi:hypothetical protein